MFDFWSYMSNIWDLKRFYCEPHEARANPKYGVTAKRYRYVLAIWLFENMAHLYKFPKRHSQKT